MNKIRYVKIQFDKQMMPYDIPKFRGAVIEASERKSNLFHNHYSNEEFIYRYPLIQYKIINKKPSIICLNEGTDDIHYLLNNREFNFRIDKEMIKFEIEEIYLKYFLLQPWNENFKYHLHNWLPLNQENYVKYNELEGLGEKIEFLDEILYKHLEIMIEELKINSEIKLQSKILEIKEEDFLPLKGQYLKSMKINFKTNLSLPDYIGIGKGSSVGFGIIKKLTD